MSRKRSIKVVLKRDFPAFPTICCIDMCNSGPSKRCNSFSVPGFSVGTHNFCPSSNLVFNLQYSRSILFQEKQPKIQLATFLCFVICSTLCHPSHPEVNLVHIQLLNRDRSMTVIFFKKYYFFNVCLFLFHSKSKSGLENYGKKNQMHKLHGDRRQNTQVANIV